MKAHFNNIAIRWALIGGIALCTPWFVSHSKSSARSDGLHAPVFRIGEVLNYRVDWGRYTGAASAQLQIVDRSDFEGLEAWHFRATVHTAEPVRALYPMDDQIDSYAVPGNLTSRQYQERLREFGSVETTDALLVSSGDVASLSSPRVIVPPGTHDALSAIYFLRMADWTAGTEIRAPVFDGENVYQMRAKASVPSAIHVMAGTYQATKIEIHLFDGSKEIPDESFNLWLADDPARTPVLCEAQLTMGSLRIELTGDSASDAHAGPPAVTPQANSSHPAGN
jgi:hypothetical protein